MGKPLPEGAKRILDGLHFAHIATLMPNGPPPGPPRRAPRPPPPLARPSPPLQRRGRVVEIIRGEDAVDGFVEVSKKYGNPNPQRPPAAERVVYKIEALSVVSPQT